MKKYVHLPPAVRQLDKADATFASLRRIEAMVIRLKGTLA
jgi:hypothetical protein